MDHTYSEYRTFLYRFFLKHVKNPNLAEDLAQDVFLKFWLKKEEIASIDHLDAWLFRLAKNHLTDHYRRLAVEKKYQEATWQEMERQTNRVIKDIYRKELEAEIAALVAGLPPRQKEVFELSRHKGMSLAEIAAALDISPNTAKNHLVQALKTIKAGIRPIYFAVGILGDWFFQ